jgi:hypothetical protein
MMEVAPAASTERREMVMMFPEKLRCLFEADVSPKVVRQGTKRPERPPFSTGGTGSPEPRMQRSDELLQDLGGCRERFTRSTRSECGTSNDVQDLFSRRLRVPSRAAALRCGADHTFPLVNPAV